MYGTMPLVGGLNGGRLSGKVAGIVIGFFIGLSIAAGSVLAFNFFVTKVSKLEAKYPKFFGFLMVPCILWVFVSSLLATFATIFIVHCFARQ
jgi:hypothetical protein